MVRRGGGGAGFDSGPPVSAVLGATGAGGGGCVCMVDCGPGYVGLCEVTRGVERGCMIVSSSTGWQAAPCQQRERTTSGDGHCRDGRRELRTSRLEPYAMGELQGCLGRARAARWGAGSGLRRARVRHVYPALTGRPGHDGLLRRSAGPGQEAWHVGRGARGMGLESTKITLYDVDIHLTTGIDRVLACAHFPDVTRSRGPCSEARTVGGVGRCIVAPGICARRQMRGQALLSQGPVSARPRGGLPLCVRINGRST